MGPCGPVLRSMPAGRPGDGQIRVQQLESWICAVFQINREGSIIKIGRCSGRTRYVRRGATVPFIRFKRVADDSGGCFLHERNLSPDGLPVRDRRGLQTVAGASCRLWPVRLADYRPARFSLRKVTATVPSMAVLGLLKVSVKTVGAGAAIISGQAPKAVARTPEVLK